MANTCEHVINMSRKGIYCAKCGLLLGRTLNEAMISSIKLGDMQLVRLLKQILGNDATAVLNAASKDSRQYKIR